MRSREEDLDYYKKRYQTRRATNIEAVRAADREGARRWRARNPALAHLKARRHSLMRKYGLTLEAWQQLFASQGCRCAICRSDHPGSKHGWHTDHDHSTGSVRGILCKSCNQLLGYLGDSLEPLQERVARITAYLEAPPAQKDEA